jgi:tyrosinase
LVHNVAAFLPWHRYFIMLYEEALVTCGYSGPAMYWDCVASSSTPSKAAVFSPTTSFGGNGDQASDEWGTNCVLDGPFKTLQLRWETWECVERSRK